MADLTIVGGVYVERCVQPLWDNVYGSGGRAAEAVARLVPGRTRLVAYVGDLTRPPAEFLAGMAGFALEPVAAAYAVSFDYLHPLSTPRIRPGPAGMAQHEAVAVDGDVVLRYGMLEGDAIVDAGVAVYDPQSAFGARPFGENGSRADRLAVVLNRREAASMTGTWDAREAAGRLLRDGAEVVVVKMGGHGALVVTADAATKVPAYQTRRVWKIGSGDVFSATFAALWGCRGLPPGEAADLASRATARYCETRSLSVTGVEDLEGLDLSPVRPGRGRIYLAAPFFDLGQRWLVDEARSLLRDLGAEVFSPCHDVGPGPGAIVAPEDLAGLDGSDAVFAILNGLDTGTVFEVGYAVRKGIPVVALAQNVKDEDLKMLTGTGCTVLDDFASALYQAVWRLPPT